MAYPKAQNGWILASAYTHLLELEMKTCFGFVSVTKVPNIEDKVEFKVRMNISHVLDRIKLYASSFFLSRH